MIELRGTLRLQFHQGFTLDDAVPLVPYFSRLGISHVYASPLLTARPGSMHGYDVVDPTRINPELGGEPGLLRFVEALHGRGIGLILDIVPNHMAVGGDANPWWLDLLEWGQNSPYAKFFDIQWHSHDPLLAGQLLVPFLRCDYGQALSEGSIGLHFDRDRGAFYAQHFEHRLPITPPSFGEILRGADQPQLSELAGRFDALRGAADAWQNAHELFAELSRLGSPDVTGDAIPRALARYRCDSEEGLQRLHRLLERQHYRVASWRTAADDINWRRFFDINELGGLRVERPEVFELTHEKIFELVERGLVDGLRIDHVDGLANPRAYCRRLRRRIDGLLEKRPQAMFGQHFPIYVEKILGAGEHLPVDWNVDGTTGYEFMNQVSLLQHDPQGEQTLRALWSELSGRTAEFAEEVLEARRLVLGSNLAGDLEEVAQGLLQVARNDIATRDLTLGSIRRALVELIVHFPVYRTYVSACGRSEQDQRIFQQALDGARQTLAETDWPMLDHLDRWLGGQPLFELPPGRPRKLRARVMGRFQQLTSPVAAKAVEDTAFYRSGLLLSRYDVGFEAEHFSRPPEHFHQCCQERAQHFPTSLLGTATHDHKRGEDSRTRLAVISERADWFAERVRHWRQLAEPLRTSAEAPSAGEELILYQALLGSWPLQLGADDEAGLQAYLQRMRGWQEKALREAKLNSSWSAPNAEHEAACGDFLERLLTAPEGLELRRELVAAVDSLAPAGALNSLVQCLLRLSAPGVPDLYQGCEYWDFSMVDPDNRRPVDFDARVDSLSGLEEPGELLRQWRDGRIKQWLIANLLAIRHARPQLFTEGDYRPLQVVGEQADRVLAFSRSLGDVHLVAVVPRLAAGLLGNRAVPHVPAERWGDTRVVLPPEFSDLHLTGIFPPHQPDSRGELPLAEVLADFPVNLFCLKPLPAPGASS
ncbi:malto-oligosyltrehalose synthase [Pseudomonas subflava]|uniref:malto-oligosyltrehalose synthase n=1 Tax=Pseudomonas subflava TaxID=2952933 RepID=UPI00207A9068|nr:malto-oligosyltrehalose synthase [Pseudomonas subflava]